MKKILLFSRDPGGANTIIPLVEPLRSRGYGIALWGKDTALDKYRAAGTPGQDIMNCIKETSADSLREFISAQSPDLIITGTSAEDFCEKYIWKAAEELGIMSFAIIDQWLNYGIRFSAYPYSRVQEFLKRKEYPYLPSKIFLMDELAMKDALEEGLPANRLLITGQPHLQVMMEKEHISPAKINAIRHSLDVGPRDVLMVFASEPITETFGAAIPSFGYTEQTILNALIEELQKITEAISERVVLVIRPHPRERRDKFDQIISTDRFKIIVSRDHDSGQLIESADCICGMSSMFLLESAVLGKPIVSIQIGLKGESLFVLDRNEMIKSVRNKAELALRLRQVMVGQEFKPQPLSFIADPISRIMTQVDEVLR